MTQKDALYNYCLRNGDNALILGHRLSEWCSNAPLLEEDLALTNMALDLIGRAQALLNYTAETEGKEKTGDDLAYKRAERKFLNNLITELPNKDFAYTIVRQLFFSVYEFYLYGQLCESSDKSLSAIAHKAIKEVSYHLAHAEDWTMRLGDGTEESHARMQKAVNDLWQYTGEFFEMDEADAVLIDEKIAPDLSGIKIKWEERVREILREATLAVPENVYMQTGGRKGIHTEYLGHILAEMQYLPRAYPDAKWM